MICGFINTFSVFFMTMSSHYAFTCQNSFITSGTSAVNSFDSHFWRCFSAWWIHYAKRLFLVSTKKTINSPNIDQCTCIGSNLLWKAVKNWTHARLGLSNEVVNLSNWINVKSCFVLVIWCWTFSYGFLNALQLIRYVNY